jgi:CheY-like chemotaxis protein
MSQTIVIIEDDTRTYHLIASVLQRDGYQVAHAENGETGIDLIRKLQPGLVIMDLRLPQMNGWEATSILKQATDTAHIPIIAVSVEVDTGDLQRALSAGCVDYLQKPFDIQRLREMVQQHVLV